MRRSQHPIVIASRRSPLARVQAELVGETLSELHGGLEVKFRWIESAGGPSDTPNPNTPTKGRFTREVEQCIIDGRADIAVHSLKDLPALPANQTPGLIVAAVPFRDDPRDCLIGRDGATILDHLPSGAVVGTGSPRRAAQLRRARPDVNVSPIQGNIETRLAKLKGDSDYHAIILARAGLERLGFDDLVTAPLDSHVMLPAPAQGALALQCRGDDGRTLRRCIPLNDGASAFAVSTERQVAAALNADCHTAVAALLESQEDRFTLHVRVLKPDGTACVESKQTCSARELSDLVPITVDNLQRDGVGYCLGTG